MILNQEVQITITSEDQLMETWVDPQVPHMRFGFTQSSLDDCVDNGDGTYTATYLKMELLQPQVFTYIDPESGETTITLPAGIYGEIPG